MGQIQDPNESTTFGNSLSLRVDGAVGAMSLSPNGRDAVLAGRRGLFIIDLDDPFTTPRWLHHITSWEVADVQWSPHHSVKPSWCISTSNQKALLWDLERPSNNAILNVLHKHTRAITDINFHPFDPEILSTCSIDTFVLSWDMRTPRRPVAQWAEWRAGATQVKWNHENPYEIASSHDHDFYVWDTRKGALPLLKIADAHSGKINGLDFSNGRSNIITCSNDKKIKSWNLNTLEAKNYASSFDYFDSGANNSKLSPSVVIETDYAIARARSLPFGQDRACGIMPLIGGDESIHIVNYDSAYKLAQQTKETQCIKGDSIHSFKGHSGAIKDFLWRTRSESYEGFESKHHWKDYQLVTWSSQDYDLKLWPHSEELYKSVNYNPSHQTIVNDLRTGEEEEDEEVAQVKFDEFTNKGSAKFIYDTYCIEPTVSIEDITRKKNGDLLSALTSFQIEKNQKSTNAVSQLNHLDWISGVRMGRAGHDPAKDNTNGNLEDNGPYNLGEEVSIVGHKFPKIRFEKISVSTGELVISLKGPVPIIETNIQDKSLVIAEMEDQVTSENEKDKEPEKSSKVALTADNSAIASNEDSEVNSSLAKSVKPTTTNDESNQEQKLIFIRINIKFPKGYPYIEHSPETLARSKSFKNQKNDYLFFDIEETHELTTAIKNEMLENLKEISEFYTGRFQKFCLEPCLRYLMGDKIELDDSLMIDENLDSDDDSFEGEGLIQEVGTEGWADDLINQQPDFDSNQMHDDSSGEEYGDEFGDLMPAIDQDNLEDGIDPMDGKNSITNNMNENILSENKEGSNLNTVPEENTFYDSTPIPKGCSAMWSHTGQLVCFFIPKNNEEETKELQKFNIFNFTDGGFSIKTSNGKHSHNHSHNGGVPHGHYQHKVSSKGSVSDSEDGGNVSDSDSLKSGMSESDSISSDESFTDDWDDILQDDLPARSRIPGFFKTSIGLGNRYIAQGNKKSSLNRFTSHGGTSNHKSSIPGETSQVIKAKKSREEKKNKNIVGIFDFRHLLPAKYELACEYRVLGDVPEKLARYNSEVALKYGLKEISDVWRILEQILVKEVDSRDIFPLYWNEQVHPKALKDNEEMNQLIQSSKIITESKKQRFYWGTHPFGHTWLIKQIFNYFESKGNIQMLAMISCILYENSNNIIKDSSGLFNVPIHTPYQVLPPAPSVIEMHQMNENNQNSVYRNNSRGSFEIQALNSNILKNDHNADYSKSINSSHEVSNSSPIPPGLFYRHSEPHLQIGQYSSSNDIARENQLGSNFKHRIKHINPVAISKQKVAQNKYTQRSNGPRPPPIITIDMQNSESLDLFDDVYSTCLLDSQDDFKIKAYREEYAEMLYLWGLPINRIKILKFNYPDKEYSKEGVSQFDVHKCYLGSRNMYKQGSNVASISGQKYVKPARINAWNSDKKNSLKFCNLCNLIVTKSLVVCTNCEHVLHSHCAIEWWSESSEGDLECPSGCGCKCLDSII